jgi:probable HAF family extracellular repeat protein
VVRAPMKITQPVTAAPEAKGAARKTDVFHVVDLGRFDNNRHDILALNDVGQCVGVSQNPESGRIEAFLEDNGLRTSLGTLGGSFSIAHDINNQGEVVGGSLIEGDESFHGFIYRDGQLHDLNDCLDPASDWELIQAVGINNCGEILAIASHGGDDRIVLLRPQELGQSLFRRWTLQVGSHPKHC